MSNLGETIRSISNQTYEASKPTMRLFGTVESINPLRVRINEKLILEGSVLVVTQIVKTYIDWGFLTMGDSVVMTRQAGGQKYIIDDMVASDKDMVNDIFLNHTHQYVDDNWLAKAKKKTKTGKWVEKE